MAAAAPEERIVILMPVYDDWQSASVLVGRLHAALRGASGRSSTCWSTTARRRSRRAHLRQRRRRAAASVQILRLRRNLGHQRAIAIGLTWVHAQFPCRGVLVMDADGEDTPEGAVRLLERFEQEGGEEDDLCPARARRTEGAVFRAF